MARGGYVNLTLCGESRYCWKHCLNAIYNYRTFITSNKVAWKQVIQLEIMELSTTLCHDSDHSVALEVFSVKKSTLCSLESYIQKWREAHFLERLWSQLCRKTRELCQNHVLQIQSNIHSNFHKPTLHCHPPAHSQHLLCPHGSPSAHLR